MPHITLTAAPRVAPWDTATADLSIGYTVEDDIHPAQVESIIRYGDTYLTGGERAADVIAVWREGTNQADLIIRFTNINLPDIHIGTIDLPS